MKPKHLICGGLLLIAAALAFTGYNLWEDQRAAQAARQALTAMEAQTAEEGERAPEQPSPLCRSMCSTRTWRCPRWKSTGWSTSEP